LASTFFAGVNVGADTLARQMLDRELSRVPVDIRVRLGYFGYLGSPPSSDNFTRIVDKIVSPPIDGVSHVEVMSKLYGHANVLKGNETSSKHIFFRILGISEHSRIYEGITVVDGSSPLKTNEAYVWVNSENVEELELGDVLQFNLTIGWIYKGKMGPPQSKTFVLNLTVVGFVDIDEQALKIIWGDRYTIQEDISYQIKENILIVDWEETFARIIDVYYNEFIRSPNLVIEREVDTEVLIFLDRDSVINLWDIEGSLRTIETIEAQVSNRVQSVLGRGVYVDNRLEYVLERYLWTSQNMRMQFTITSLPVFFIAWYMGTTVSDVSYNLRRREIGLLLAKGFSRRQLLRMFLGESALIGLVGGLIGIGLSFTMTPLFVQDEGFFTVTPVIGVDTIIITFIFSVGLTLLAVFRPARRASKLDIVDALQEYRYVEEVKPHKERWPWAALILGSYKIAMWLLGINLITLMMRPLPIYNILIIIMLEVPGVRRKVSEVCRRPQRVIYKKCS